MRAGIARHVIRPVLEGAVLALVPLGWTVFQWPTGLNIWVSVVAGYILDIRVACSVMCYRCLAKEERAILRERILVAGGLGLAVATAAIAGLGWTVFQWPTLLNIFVSVAASFISAGQVCAWYIRYRHLTDDKEQAKRRRRVLVGWGLAMAAASGAVAVLGWTVFQWPTSLNVSIAAMAGFILIFQTAALAWERGYKHVADAKKEQAAKHNPNPWKDAATVAITTQGVVLGLIFIAPGKRNLTVNVGAASLAVGLLIASGLYLLVARLPPMTPGQHATSSVLLNLLLWALGFGLLCVVAGGWPGS